MPQHVTLICLQISKYVRRHGADASCGEIFGTLERLYLEVTQQRQGGFQTARRTRDLPVSRVMGWLERDVFGKLKVVKKSLLIFSEMMIQIPLPTRE